MRLVSFLLCLGLVWMTTAEDGDDERSSSSLSLPSSSSSPVSSWYGDSVETALATGSVQENSSGDDEALDRRRRRRRGKGKTKGKKKGKKAAKKSKFSKRRKPNDPRYALEPAHRGWVRLPAKKVSPNWVKIDGLVYKSADMKDVWINGRWVLRNQF